MGRKGAKKQRRVFAVCLGLLFWCAVIPYAAGEENQAASGAASEESKKAAMDETLKELSSKGNSVEAGKETSFQEGQKKGGGKEEEEQKKSDESERIKEKEFFMQSADVSWELSDEKLVVQIMGPEKEEAPSGEISFEQEGLVARWRPAGSVLLRKKKKNRLNSPWVSEILFQEDAGKTKVVGAPAPYYALDAIELHFTELVSSNTIRGKKSLKLEFRPLKKRKLITPKEAVPEEDLTPGELPPSSPGDILGTVYQAKTEYEAYMIGGSRAAETLRKFRAGREPRKGLYDGKLGFPQDMSEVFEEAYPSFGSLEYWKKYVKAVFDQTVGFSSDYDSNYGAWGGFRANNPAMTWEPDLAVSYLRPGVITPTVEYQVRRACPVSRLLHFADGRQEQRVSVGAGYTPKKPYAIYLENGLYFFKDKTLVQNDNGSIARQANKGIRMTNALGINYRLTRRLLWKVCGGQEGTRSDKPDSGRSRTDMGFLGTDLAYSFTKRLSAALGYSYRHTFKNTGSPSGPVIGYVKDAKGNDLQSPSIGLNYQPFKQLKLAGSITPAIIDGQYYKFGGEVSFKYQRSKVDDLSFKYSNAVAQDDTAQLTGKNVSGGIGRAGNVQLLRNEEITAEYNYWFVTERVSKMNLRFLLTYKRALPLSGLSSSEGSIQDGLRFEASLRRKLRGGRLWLELTYRFENYHANGIAEEDTLDSSVKENSVFFSITNYFGN